MFGLYIHIPYCRSKCRYCDFYSTPCPDGVPEAYIDALCREMDRFSPCGSTPLRPDTLYFGGGTPSLLTPAQAARLIRAAGPAPGAEITLEANPETVTPERLAAFRRAGVNRLYLSLLSKYLHFQSILHQIILCDLWFLRYLQTISSLLFQKSL